MTSAIDALMEMRESSFHVAPIWSTQPKQAQQNIKIKYFDPACKIEKISKGDWIDLRSRETMHLTLGEFRKVPLGIAMQLPEGYEAHIAPRSSSFQKWKFMTVNSIGIIDNSYCGDNDEWHLPIYSLGNKTIHKGDRICQFRIVEKQPAVSFDEVETLGNPDRGGFGSTGVK